MKDTTPNVKNGGDGLTERQRILAEEKAKGSTDMEACKSAGYNPKTPQAAGNQVARMMKKDEFCKYLDELRQESRGNAIMTASQIKEGLTRLLAKAEAAGDFTGYVALAARLAKMEGHDQPEKREIDLGDKTLDAVREKAKAITSALARSVE